MHACALARLLALAAFLAAAGCKSPSVPIVYRPDIQQGNVITQDMVDQLEPGMDKRKVRFVLGTPLVADTFNPDRWDYYYSFSEGGGDAFVRRISVYFQDDRLVPMFTVGPRDSVVVSTEIHLVAGVNPERQEWMWWTPGTYTIMAVLGERRQRATFRVRCRNDVDRC